MNLPTLLCISHELGPVLLSSRKQTKLPPGWAFILILTVFLFFIGLLGNWLLSAGIVILISTFFIPMRLSSKIIFILFGIALILIEIWS